MPASRMTCLPQTTLARWPHSASVGSSGLRGTFLDGACVRWWSKFHPQDMLGGVFPLFRGTFLVLLVHDLGFLCCLQLLRLRLPAAEIDSGVVEFHLAVFHIHEWRTVEDGYGMGS